MFSGQDSQCSQKRLKLFYTSRQTQQLPAQTDRHKETYWNTVESSTVISSCFWAKKHFFPIFFKIVPCIIFPLIIVCTEGARQALGQRHFGLGQCQDLEIKFFQKVAKLEDHDLLLSHSEVT